MVKFLSFFSRFEFEFCNSGWLGQCVVEDTATDSGDLGFNSRSVNSDTVASAARHRCDGSSELCYSGAKPRKRAPPLVTRVDVITRL